LARDENQNGVEMSGAVKGRERVIIVDEGLVEAAVLGGAVLGGGGGGWIEEGPRLGRAALKAGFREIRPIQRFPEDAVLLMVSSVGAPSAGSAVLAPGDYVRAVVLFLEKTGMKIDGLISSEVGAAGVVNGWVQSAALHLPVVDAPANGRAHPLGLMGAMGLHKEPGYVSVQTAVGGSLKKGNRVEVYFEGPLADVSKDVRRAAVNAGGLVAVARNPVTARYVKENGAPEAVRMAVELGNRLLTARPFGPRPALEEIFRFLGAGLHIEGKVVHVALRTEGGLDIGQIQLRSGETLYELTFWNEYMTLDRDGTRLAAFPDLMMTFDLETAMPLISAQIREGQEAALIAVPAARLILGAGMRDQGLLELVERAIGKKIFAGGE
jgi:uncharacterized protein